MKPKNGGFMFFYLFLFYTYVTNMALQQNVGNNGQSFTAKSDLHVASRAKRPCCQSFHVIQIFLKRFLKALSFHGTHT